MIKAVIFDLDGVIVSTDHYHYLAWKQLADELGIYFDEKINEGLRGVSRKESLDIILKNSNKLFSESEKNEFLTRKNNYYLELIKNLSSDDVSIEVRKVLDYLTSKNIKKAIGSSSKNAVKILNYIGLLNEFDVIVDGNMIKYSKPDPEVFVLAAKMLNENKDNCLVVEDAIAGIDASYNGGIRALSISSAYEYEKSTYTMKELSAEKFIKIIEGER